MNFKVYSKEVHIETGAPFEFVDITEVIKNEVKESQVRAGISVINVLHTTAAVVVQESDPLVHKDAKNVLDRLVPYNLPYNHKAEGTINAAAHQKQQLLGSVCVLPVNDGELTIGTWQRVFLVELFKPMKRRVQITLLGT
jgi:secondary thiamine-phosphate synthase enzyme